MDDNDSFDLTNDEYENMGEFTLYNIYMDP